MSNDFLLTLSCDDRPGLVAAVSSHLFQVGGNILESSQYNDPGLDRFFMRITFAMVRWLTRSLCRVTQKFMPCIRRPVQQHSWRLSVGW